MTPTPTLAQIPAGGGSVGLGDLVEVVGTGVGGLRLRSTAGLNGEVRFLAVENEVLRVEDGPVELDGYVWWFLVNPYSTDKQGWGAVDYLRPLG
jgi:hypothetical protein